MSGISPISPATGVNPALNTPAVAKPNDAATGKTDFLDGLRDSAKTQSPAEAQPADASADASTDSTRPENIQATLDRINGLESPTGGNGGYDPFGRMDQLQNDVQERMRLFDDLRGQINRGEADANDPAVKGALAERTWST